MSNPAWERACLALDLLSIDPAGLRGIVVRARSGPVRDTFVSALTRLKMPLIKLHPAMPRDTLLGGLDLSQTLSSGHLVQSDGVLAQSGTLVMAMAERCPPDMAAILAAHLDADPDLTLVLMDEGSEDDECAPRALAERLAFHVDLDGIGRLEAVPPPMRRIETDSAQLPPTAAAALTTLAARLGIESLRAPSLAMAAARAHARLSGREIATDEDLAVAAELVLAPRATQMPEQPHDGETPPPDTSEPNEQSQSDGLDISEEMLIEAVKALLPSDLLDSAQTGASRGAKGSGAGKKKKGNRRGRPLPSRPGRLDGQTRLDLVATLRAAAPWQVMRKRGDGPVKVMPSDIHLKRYEEQSDRLIIFAVDASGSSALARLGEAKGAVELMLARAYAARDHVALIAFRGTDAQVLLPPTRSLVQTKRRLAALPGGGGTPLAAGLKAAGELAVQAQAQGLTPMLALLTDGRGNIALDGTGNRAQAGLDASKMATWLRAEGLAAVVLDLGTRPQPALAELSKTLGAQYLPLPRADAQRMSDALGAAIQDGLGA